MGGGNPINIRNRFGGGGGFRVTGSLVLGGPMALHVLPSGALNQHALQVQAVVQQDMVGLGLLKFG